MCLYIFLCEYMIQSHAIFPLAVTCHGCATYYVLWWIINVGASNLLVPSLTAARHVFYSIFSIFFFHSFCFCLAWVPAYEILSLLFDIYSMVLCIRHKRIAIPTYLYPLQTINKNQITLNVWLRMGKITSNMLYRK